MNAATSDLKTLFDRWFEQPIAKLEQLDNKDGGTAGMMIVLPLFERYITIRKLNDTSKRSWYQIMADELKLAGPDEAEVFWATFSHGFCHTAIDHKKSSQENLFHGCSSDLRHLAKRFRPTQKKAILKVRSFGAE